MSCGQKLDDVKGPSYENAAGDFSMDPSVSVTFVDTVDGLAVAMDVLSAAEVVGIDAEW